MKTIKYTSLISTAVSEEGSAGMFTNYVIYTYLVVYSDGSRQIVSGKDYEVSKLAAFIRTPMDKLEEINDTIRKMGEDLPKVNEPVIRDLDQKMQFVVNALYPIPDIQDKNELIAAEMVKDAGLEPVLEVEYPDSVPKTGYVRTFKRFPDNFRKISLRVIHDVPGVDGMKLEDALEKLRQEGFEPEVIYKPMRLGENDVVLYCKREDDSRMAIKVFASKICEGQDFAEEEETRDEAETAGAKQYAPEEIFIAQMDEENKMSEIWEAWCLLKLDGKYANLSRYIRMKADTEKQNSGIDNMEKVKEVIQNMLRKEMGE